MTEEVLTRCIKGIGNICLASAKAGDEEGVIHAMDSLMNVLPKPTKTFEEMWAEKTPEEKKAKIDHIMGWLEPFIAGLEK